MNPLKSASYAGFSNVITTALVLSVLSVETTMVTAALILIGCFGSGFIIAALLIGRFG